MVTKTGGGPVVGLDIGTSFIKAVEVRPGKRPQVTALGITPTPPDAFAGDVIADPPALGYLVRKLLDESGIHARKVVSSVSGQSSFVMRVLPLPKMTPKELKETMKFEVERQVPFPSSEVIMDYHPLVRPDEPEDATEMSVLLVVGQQQMIDSHVETLLAAGLEPIAIDVESLAALRAVLDDNISNQTVALVNLGASKTDLAIFERGVLMLPRPIPVAGDALTQAIAGALGRPLEESEALKKQYGEVSLEPLAAPASLMPEPMGGEAPAAEGDFSFFDFSGPAFGGATEAAAPEPPAQESAFADAGEEVSPVSAFSLEDEPGAASPPSPFTLEDEEAGPAPARTAFSLEDDEPSAFSFQHSTSTSEPQPLEPQAAAPQEPSEFGFDLEPPAEEPTASEPEAAIAPIPESERLKRQIQQAIAPVVGDLVTEIRRSLDFYRNRSAEGVIHRIYLCGGTAKLKNLDRFLEQELGAPVQVLEPSQKMDASGRYATARYFDEVAPVAAVGIGLGLRDVVDYGPRVTKVPKAPKTPKAPKAPRAERAKKG